MHHGMRIAMEHFDSHIENLVRSSLGPPLGIGFLGSKDVIFWIELHFGKTGLFTIAIIGPK